MTTSTPLFDDTATDLDQQLDQIEHVIETLDTSYLLGEPTINPITLKAVSDPDYDKLYGQNGSERALLKKHRPDSRVLKGVTAANVNFSAATKCVHNPPMTSIAKADGGLPHKQKRLGEWMVNALAHLKITTPYDRSIFAFKKGDSTPTFEKDEKEVIKALIELATTKDAKGQPVFVLSLKHDGCAVSLYYKNGKLVAAGNRPRDGINAASVLDHVRQVTGIPNSVLVKDFTGAIRGEIECRISDFEAVNKSAKAAGKKTYENPRNATAGAMNPLGDPKVAAERKLSFVGYSIENFDNAPYATANERAMWVNKTLKVPFIRVNPFHYDELQRIEDKLRTTLDYQIDGIIIEVNDLAGGEDWGREGDKSTGDPRWKIAWKFAAETATPIVKGITWGVGKHGRVTPVAFFDGVRLAGTTVQNCTIHNVGQLIDGQVGIGATIRIYKAGEIIPYWSETIKPAAVVSYPDKCPSCGAKLEFKKSTTATDLICINTAACPAQNVGKLVGYLSAFGVKGIAESIVNTLIAEGLVKTPADFYRLDEAKLKKAGFSERESLLIVARLNMIESADKVKDNNDLRIKIAKAVDGGPRIPLPLNKFIACLQIPGASRGTGTSLATHFGDIDKVLIASKLDLTGIEDIGPKKADAVHAWLSDHHYEVKDLLKYIAIEKPKSGIFNGKTFCFSGSFTPDKEHWISLVEDQGAKVSSTPSKKTDYFVHGPGSGNKKDRAEELKASGVAINIIEVDDLEKLLGINKTDDRAF
jgi:DNA ligase (NAD+)